MTRAHLIATVILPVGLALAGCALDPEPELGSTSSEVTGCPRFNGCGDNSPVMGPFDFHDLNVDHLPNAEGLVIERFVRGVVTTYEPRIENGSQLVATDPVTQTTISGTGLVGGYFEIRATSTNELYRLYIAGVTVKATSPVTFWVGPATRIETYELVYTGPRVSGRTPLCAHPTPSTTESWPRPLEAMLVTGDRYNATSLTVSSISATDTAGWFNIECSGSAIAKTHLMRYTNAGSIIGLQGGASWLTTLLQRQALLKMYTGDFCGNGMRWTVGGTPLHWTNRALWTATTASAITGGESANEGYWNAMGATCLDAHRISTEYKADILASCGSTHALPACSPLPLDAPPAAWPTNAVLRSVVP